MCKFCKDSETIINEEFISSFSWGWGGDISIKQDELKYINYGLFIDRGYIRFVDLDDSQCLDSGLKCGINFCPFCGIELTNGI